MDGSPDSGPVTPQGERPLLDDMLSVSIYELQRWSRGADGAKEQMPWEALYAMHREGPPPKIYLLSGRTGFRLSLESGHDFAALKVPVGKRQVPSPAPAGAGPEVAPWDLPAYAVVAVPNLSNFQDLHLGFTAKTHKAAIFVLHACPLMTMPSALVVGDSDAVAWVDTQQACLRGVRFFHAPPGRGRSQRDGSVFWSGGCLGSFPAEAVARTCTGPCTIRGSASFAAPWRTEDPTAKKPHRGGPRTYKASAFQ